MADRFALIQRRQYRVHARQYQAGVNHADLTIADNIVPVPVKVKGPGLLAITRRMRGDNGQPRHR